MAAYILDDSDVAILKEMLAAYKNRRTTPPRYPAEEPDPTAPETYIALTPTTGIPASFGLDITGTGTGMSTAVGAGLGEAECNIYRVLDIGGIKELEDTGLTETVINLSTTDIDGSTVISINRDKFGDWLTNGVGGGSADSAEMIRLTGDSSGDLLDGYIQIWNPITHQWSDGEQVWVVDANDPP